MTSLLTLASQAGYDPNGTPEIYSSTSPYARNMSSILPGVDLTSVPVVGRGMLIAPDVVVRAYHNRSSIGSSYTFVAADGTPHVRTQIELSDKIGEDGVLARLDSPLPSTITPARVLSPKVHEYSLGESVWAYRVAYAAGHRLVLGELGPVSDSGRFKITEITGQGTHWDAPVGGDSGGANFIVCEGAPLALGGTWNTSSEGTFIGDRSFANVLRSFSSDIQAADFWNTDLNPNGRPQIKTPDKSITFLNSGE